MMFTRFSGVAAGLLVTVFAVPAAGQATAPKRDFQAAMRQFVQTISAQTKKADPSFLVVPQGGIALLTVDGRPATDYLKAIDGVGQEEVFYG